MTVESEYQNPVIDKRKIERKEFNYTTTNHKENNEQMVIIAHLSITILNVNGLTLQSKDIGWLNGQENMSHIHAVYKRYTSEQKIHRMKVKAWK